MPTLRRTAIWLAVSTALAASAAANAQIRTDGTLGPAQALAGPNFAIPASLGQQAGANLFHSFAQFGIPTGGSATFSGPNGIGNIISRVTGTEVSSIDGRLASSIQGANLFLINPRGIVFGPNASLDLTGSFYASTANYLKLADGTRFDATATVPAVLSMAPPAAFGFLGPTGSVTVQGSQLQVAEGKSINLVGGPIAVSDASLTTLAGELRLVGVAGTGEASLVGEVAAGTTAAPITVQRSSLWTESANGAAPGRILIRGGHLTLADSSITSVSYEQADAPPVELAASGDLTVSATTVTSYAVRSGRGAGIALTGDNVTVQRNSQVGSRTFDDGRGGDVTITARNTARVLAAAEDPDYTNIYSWAFGSGNGGNLQVTGDTVMVRSGNVYSYTGGSGAGGAIGLRGREVSVLDGAWIYTYNWWGTAGRGGDINVTAAEQLRIAGRDWNGSYAFVFAQTLGGGRGGDIRLRAEDVSVAASGQIASIAGGSGRGGDIDIAAARSFYASDEAPGGDAFFKGIRSYTLGQGDAGGIHIAAPEIALVGASITSNTYDAGNAGSLRFDGEVIRVLAGNGGGSQIESGSSNFTTGSGGSVEFRATREFELNGASVPGEWTRIAATTQGNGLGGDILIQSPKILIQQGSLFSRTRFGTGDQGGITVRGDEVRLQNGGEIGSGTEGNRKGSFILIDAQSVDLSDTSIIYAATIGSGDAGQVTIDAERVRMTGASSILANSSGGSGNAGGIVINAGESFQMTDRRPLNARQAWSSSNAAVWPGGLFAQASGTGNAGRILVRAPNVLLDDGRILSTALGSGQGGRVEIQTGDLVMRNGAQVDAQSAEGSSGDAGSIDVAVTGRFEISGRSPIDSALSGLYAETQGSGRGGSLGVDADTLVVDRGIIRSSTSGSGDAGAIRIRGGDVLLLNGGWIDAGASQGSTGAGGSIDLVAARSLAVRGIDRTPIAPSLNDLQPLGVTPGKLGRAQGAFPSTISSNTAGSGPGGSVTLSAPSIRIEDGARVSATSTGTGNAGSISISAGDALRLFGGSTISSEALQADGGDIDIRAGNLVHLKNSEISTAVGAGLGAGGNIFIDPTFVVLENSRIVANAFGGSGGNIRIIAQYLLSNPGSLIDASSRLGTSGSVQIAALNTNLANELAALPAQVLDTSAMLRDSCSARVASGGGGSSLVGVGRGGLAASPERFAASTYFGTTGALASTPTDPGPIGLKLHAAQRARLIIACSA
jgi:filamentous hemagglutinin family protein